MLTRGGGPAQGSPMDEPSPDLSVPSPMLDHQLKRQSAVPFADFGAIRRPDRRRQQIRVAEQNRVEALVAAPEGKPRMGPADHALVEHRERIVEYRRRKSLAPDLGPKHCGKLEGKLA